MNSFSQFVGGHFGFAVSQAVANIPLILGEPGPMNPLSTRNQTIVSGTIEISERQRALVIRAAWMKRMGLAQEEIDRACNDPKEPIDLTEEIENLQAAEKLPQTTPPSSELKKWATDV
jgi:hypothetical protein